MKSAKALVNIKRIRRKTSKNEIVPAHPPFPCIRQEHTVNLLKLYRNHKWAELWFLNQEWLSRYSASTSTAPQPPPADKMGNTSRRLLQAVREHVRTLKTAGLHSLKVRSQRGENLFWYTTNKSFQEIDGLVLKYNSYIYLYIYIICHIYN